MSDLTQVYLNPSEDNKVKQNSVSRQLLEYVALGNATVTPDHFGAVGDGVTADDLAIYKWLNSGKPYLYVPDKTYLIADGFTYGFIPNTVRHIFGPGTLKNGAADGSFNFAIYTSDYAGDSLLIENITIDASFSTAPTKNGIGLLESASRIVIRNVKIIGGNYGIYGAHDNLAADVTIEGCDFRDYSHSAIIGYQAARSTSKYNVLNNYMKGGDRTPNDGSHHHIQVFGGVQRIEGNTVTAASSTGGNFGTASFWPWYGSRISGNTYTDINEDGIEVFSDSGLDVSRVAITNNIITNPSGWSFDLGIGLTPLPGSEIADVFIAGNYIGGVAGPGIAASQNSGGSGIAKRVTILSNDIYNPCQALSTASSLRGGIIVAYSTSCSVEANRIYNSTTGMDYGVQGSSEAEQMDVIIGSVRGYTVAESTFTGVGCRKGVLTWST